MITKLAPIITLLLFTTVSLAGNITPVLNSIKPNSITIIGETHQRPESIQLFQDLIKGYLKNNKCLTVALEIRSNQQPIINQIIQGRAAVSDIEIAYAIDYPLFRTMINDLALLKRNGACLELLAIDAGDDVDMKRDEWMAINLAGQVGETPVLVLLGGLHSLKKVNWDLSMTKGTIYVAEILSKQGYQVTSYPLDWSESECSSDQQFHHRLVAADTAEALVLLNKSFFSLLNAFEPDSAVGVVDGVILWECAA